jgi:hypothetical protein
MPGGRRVRSARAGTRQGGPRIARSAVIADHFGGPVARDLLSALVSVDDAAVRVRYVNAEVQAVENFRESSLLNILDAPHVPTPRTLLLAYLRPCACAKNNHEDAVTRPSLVLRCLDCNFRPDPTRNSDAWISAGNAVSLSGSMLSDPSGGTNPDAERRSDDQRRVLHRPPQG